jgi:thiosulfate/3-mercaptopyruvate sulfurtransferase
MNNKTGPLVSTDWLLENINLPHLRIVDASWYLPTMDRNPRAEYADAHIPSAVFFDIDEIADLNSDLPHMLPSAEKFALRVRKLGLGDGTQIVVYDGSGLSSAARVWWMFKTFGHDNVAVLDGGLLQWNAEGKPLSNMPENSRERHFTPHFRSHMVRNADDLLALVNDNDGDQIIDARPAGRFMGTEPEPRAGLRGGHIPGSFNLPHAQLFDDDGLFLRGDALRQAFSNLGISLDAPITTSCGSGVMASVVALALDLVGHDQFAVFDGSWSEWGSRDDVPVHTAVDSA